MRRLVDVLLPWGAGLLFSLGLIFSGMVSPLKVKGFLDVLGRWDPSLALVMGGAILVALPAFQWRRHHSEGSLIRPSRIDSGLVVGSLLFGVGWGVSGYCPGPALVAASAGDGTALWYSLAMILGLLLGRKFALGGGGDH